MMLKKMIAVALILLPCMAMAQNNNQPVMMQMRDGKIYFDNTYALNAGLKKDELFARALNWFKSSFPYPDKSINAADDQKGEISGTGVFKIITANPEGHYYWIRFTVNIVVHNATYELKAFDFYEKPIESGISNEWSKIEYRWWDFRQGQPWSAEDQALFKGLDGNMNDMLGSLETGMSK
ncbi:MAG: hypothetical protein JWP78_2307 [Mucilaginibacter sp.]|nr:hypothetical protein [Mucilaginibacter sp.]